MRRLKWLIIVPVAAVLLATGGTWAYIEFVRGDAPDRLAFDRPASAAPAPPAEAGGGALDGTWTVTTGSRAGYRVDEVLFGQDTTAVGRTTDVSGTLTVAGTTVTSARVVVDLTTVRSDETRRDNQFRGRIMATSTYPNATFELAGTLELGRLPADGESVRMPATGRLTLRGTMRTVTVDLSARRNGRTIEVLGSIPVEFDDYGIPNPSFGAVTTEDHGEIEFLVVFARA
jgi:polyisoprenoid-binding protein YceI